MTATEGPSTRSGTRPLAGPSSVVTGASRFARKEGMLLVLLCATQFMIVLDATIMNVAIPSIQRGLKLEPQGLQWVVNAYVLAFGGFLILGGRMADQLGRRRMLLVGIALFGLASLIGGLANHGAVLIGARGLQGLGAAVASPASMALVAELFAIGPKRDRAFGAMGAVAAIGAASGVLLGGVLTGSMGWQWVLFVNVPVGVAVMAASLKLLPRSARTSKPTSLDLQGAASLTAALVVAVYAVVGTSAHGWASVHTALLLGASVCGFALFVWIEKRSAEPLLPLHVLRNRSLLTALTIALAHAAGPVSTLYFLSLYLQQQLDYTPLQTGLAFLPLAAAAASGAALASSMVARFGTLRLMMCGLMLMALGLVLLAPLRTEAEYVTQLLPGIVIVGCGITLAGVPMTIAAVSALGAEDSGLSSGLLNTCQQIGAALVLALLVAVSSAAQSAQLALYVAGVVLVAAALLAWLLAPKTIRANEVS
jgi:EmrB/QacA subfamily drug resistance transporter